MTNVPAYLMRIARNLCLNSKRDNKTVFPMNDIQLPTTDTPYERTELLGLVATALDALPTEYREVFVLREYDGRSYSEISDITEAPLTTVKIRLFRARARLRKILAPYIADFAE
jgi:RNA polymerase sigma factor (sigma-70 family)